jgi:hypothetical protein
MISVRLGAAGVAARLAERARRIAEAHAEARRAGPRRWRHARWLWPLFGPSGLGER